MPSRLYTIQRRENPNDAVQVELLQTGNVYEHPISVWRGNDLLDVLLPMDSGSWGPLVVLLVRAFPDKRTVLGDIAQQIVGSAFDPQYELVDMPARDGDTFLL